MKLLPVLLAICLLLSGCARYRPKSYVPPNVFKGQYLADVTSPTLFKTYNAMPQTTGDEKEAKWERRNQILTELIALVDQNYGSFENSYYGSDAVVNFGSDVANLGLTGVAAVTGTAHLKAVLAAVAGGTTGMKISYQKNFFDQQMRSAIVQKMRSGRATELAIIQNKNHMLAPVACPCSSSAPYTLEAGMNDITRYYEAGTIIGALQAITISAGQDQLAARAQQDINILSLPLE